MCGIGCQLQAVHQRFFFNTLDNGQVFFGGPCGELRVRAREVDMWGSWCELHLLRLTALFTGWATKVLAAQAHAIQTNTTLRVAVGTGLRERTIDGGMTRVARAHAAVAHTMTGAIVGAFLHERLIALCPSPSDMAEALLEQTHTVLAVALFTDMRVFRHLTITPFPAFQTRARAVHAESMHAAVVKLTARLLCDLHGS